MACIRNHHCSGIWGTSGNDSLLHVLCGLLARATAWVLLPQGEHCPKVEVQGRHCVSKMKEPPSPLHQTQNRAMKGGRAELNEEQVVWKEITPKFQHFREYNE